jgi:hypothetical protein
VPSDEARVGEYHTVRLTGTTGSTFTGTVVAAAARRQTRELPMATNALVGAE